MSRFRRTSRRVALAILLLTGVYVVFNIWNTSVQENQRAAERRQAQQQMAEKLKVEQEARRQVLLEDFSANKEKLLRQLNRAIEENRFDDATSLWQKYGSVNDSDFGALGVTISNARIQAALAGKDVVLPVELLYGRRKNGGNFVGHTLILSGYVLSHSPLRGELLLKLVPRDSYESKVQRRDIVIRKADRQFSPGDRIVVQVMVDKIAEGMFYLGTYIRCVSCAD